MYAINSPIHGRHTVKYEVELCSWGHGHTVNSTTLPPLSPRSRDRTTRELCVNAYPSLNLFMMLLQKCLEINHFFPSSLSPLPPVLLYISGVLAHSRRSSQRKTEEEREWVGERKWENSLPSEVELVIKLQVSLLSGTLAGRCLVTSLCVVTVQYTNLDVVHSGERVVVFHRKHRDCFILTIMPRHEQDTEQEGLVFTSFTLTMICCSIISPNIVFLSR